MKLSIWCWSIVIFYIIDCACTVEYLKHYSIRDLYTRVPEVQRESRKHYAEALVSIRTLHYVQYSGDNHFCSGILVSARMVLTSAHCVVNKNYLPLRANRIIVVLGTSFRLITGEDEMRMPIQDVIPHPNYQRNGEHDIAILRLWKVVGHYLTQIRSSIVSNKWHNQTTLCTTLGWGQLYPKGPYADAIIFVEVMLTDPESCMNSYPTFQSENMVCVVGYSLKQVCLPDYGAPLICNSLIYGISGWGSKCQYGKPFVYANATIYIDWIREINDDQDSIDDWMNYYDEQS